MSTLFLEAFGQLSGPPTIDCEDEDLYSVFLNRSQLMGWGAPSSNERPLLWHMEEAEITADTDPTRIGFVQVGLGVGPLEQVELPPQPRPGWAALGMRAKSTDPVLALPPLVQCFGDSLSRFGDIDVSCFVVTVIRLNVDPVCQLGHLVSMLGWFNTNLKGRVDALVSFDQNLLGGRDVSDLLANLQWRNTGAFDFRSVVDVPEQHMVDVAAEGPRWFDRCDASSFGVSVTMPEWTPSAAGWVLASTIDGARTIEPNADNFALRITRQQSILVS